jgi:hypothetical protein
LRESPYGINDIWELDDVLTIVPYEPELRNQVIITFLWDLDARHPEINAIRVRDIDASTCSFKLEVLVFIQKRIKFPRIPVVAFDCNRIARRVWVRLTPEVSDIHWDVDSAIHSKFYQR